MRRLTMLIVAASKADFYGAGSFRIDGAVRMSAFPSWPK
jgi:hypothetical protein